MIPEKLIQQAWLDLGFCLPVETDENGFIDFKLLPEDFNIGNLDAKHIPDTITSHRKTLVRPKSLLKIAITNQIWKYEIKPLGTTIEMPKGAKVLSVQMQNDVPCIWVQVNPEAEKTKRHFELLGTGHDIQCQGINREFIGTFQMHKGNLVFHLFERV